MYACAIYRRWVSAYKFRWTPILTYPRRHLKLLDWMEANIQPVAFADNNMRLGVAVVAKDMRVTINRSGLLVESGTSGLSTDVLTPTIDGILEILEPRETVMSYASVTAADSLDGADYNEERARLANRITGPGALLAGLRPVDASAVVDLQSNETLTQVEWGIVSDTELLGRLQRPSVSRIEKPTEMDGGDVSHTLSVPGNELPPVSVFTDVYVRRRQGGEVSDSRDIAAAITDTNSQAKLVSDLLVAHFRESRDGEW